MSQIPTLGREGRRGKGQSDEGWGQEHSFNLELAPRIEDGEVVVTLIMQQCS